MKLQQVKEVEYKIVVIMWISLVAMYEDTQINIRKKYDVRNSNNGHIRMMDLWMNFKSISLSRLSLIIDIDQTFGIISYRTITWIEYYTSPRWGLHSPRRQTSSLVFIVIFFKREKVQQIPLFHFHFCGSSFSNPLQPDFESRARERPWELWPWDSRIFRHFSGKCFVPRSHSVQ